MTDRSDPVADDLGDVADAATALVGVTDEGLQGLITAIGNGFDLRIVGRERPAVVPGPPGDPGPPGESIKGDPGSPGRDGTDAPRPVRVVAERSFDQRLVGARQVLSDGTTRHFDARRDVHGRIAEFVLSPGQEP